MILQQHKKYISTLCVIVLVTSCGISYDAKRKANADLSLPQSQTDQLHSARFEQDTTFTQNFTQTQDESDSSTVYILQAGKDEFGDDIAIVDIEKVTVVTSTKTVAERLGEIVVDFNVSVPRSLQDKRWSLNFVPIAEDNFGVKQQLEPIVIKGELFNDVQKRHIWQIDRYLNKILGEEEETQTNTILMAKYYEALNKQTSERKRATIEKTFNETIKFPLITEMRLDSVIRHKSDIRYYYQQVVKPTSGMRRIKLYFNSNIQAINGQTYCLPASDTLEYIISSMISLIDTTKVYRKKVISKYLVVNDRNQLGCRVNVVFKSGKSDIIDTLADNKQQIKNIRTLMDSLMYDDEFIVDTIVLTAAASPEGPSKLNQKLSEKRAYALKNYLVKDFGQELGKVLTVRWIGEDWGEFVYQMNNDSVLVNSPNRGKILRLIEGESDPDKREALIRTKFPVEYKYFFTNIYPSMRSVNFKYDLRRKGMVQDTIVTDVIDEEYLKGVQYLTEREYKKALEILLPYDNHNAALVSMSLGYNHNAYQILKQQPYLTAYGKYLLAICCSRLGKLKEGVECYNTAVEMASVLKFRAKLDPEIQDLINEAKRRKMDIMLP